MILRRYILSNLENVCHQIKSILFMALLLSLACSLIKSNLKRNKHVTSKDREQYFEMIDMKNFNKFSNQKILSGKMKGSFAKPCVRKLETDTTTKTPNSTFLSESLSNKVDLFFPNKLERKKLEAGIAEKFSARKKMLKKFCVSASHTMTQWNDSLQLIAAPEQHLVLCYVQKAGSTSWHKLIHNFVNKANNTVWGPEGHFKNRFYTRSLSEVIKQNLMKSPISTRILCVRHPFARLVSGWNDKFHKSSFSEVGKFMLEKMPGISNYIGLTSLPQRNHIISFEDFVQYIADRGLEVVDAHFKAIEQLCHPCEFPYDYIVKAESAREDLWWLLDRFNATMDSYSVHRIETINLAAHVIGKDLHKNSSLLKGQTLLIKDSVRYLFKRVQRDTIRKLMSLYYLDFIRYGYTFDIGTLEPGGFD